MLSLILKAWAISIPLSIIFFLDQGFCSIVVNAPKNKLQKPGGYHWDLCLVGLTNIFLSTYGLPWLHLVLPHSDFYVRQLAEKEETKKEGDITRRNIKKNSVIEQRLSSLVAHILIGLTIIPNIYENTIKYIPLPVYDGIFIFLAFASLYDNEVLERAMYLITDENALSDTKFLRQVPRTKINLMTLFSFLQLYFLIQTGILKIWFLGKYTKLVFPFVVLGMIPFRKYVLPGLINFCEGLVEPGSGIREKWRRTYLQIIGRNGKDDYAYMDLLDGHH